MNLLTLGVFLTGLVGVWGVAQREQDNAATRDRQRLDRLTDHAKSELSQTLRGYRFLIEGVRATFNASDWVNREEFHTIAASYNLSADFPAAEGIGFIRSVPANAKSTAAFLERTRSDGSPGFQPRPTLYPSRDPHAVIEYFGPEPSRREGQSVGREPNWVAAMERTLVCGADAATAPLNLDGGGGFVWLAPVFRDGMPTSNEKERRDAVKGWVFVPVSATRLIEDLKRNVASEISLTVIDHVSDADVACGPHQQAKLPDCSLTATRSISPGGRVWRLETAASPAFAWAPANVGMVYGLGVCLSAAIAMLIRSQASATQRAQDLALSMVDELAKNETRLKEVADRADLALDSGGMGQWDWNVVSNDCVFDARFAAQLGETVDSIEHTVEWFRSRVHPEDVEPLFEKVRRHFDHPDTRYSVEFRLLHRDGSPRWIASSGRVVERDEQGAPLRMVGVHADVTDRVVAEQEAKKDSERASELARIISESPNELFVFNRVDLRFEEVNAGAISSTGYEKPELLGMTPVDLKPDFDEASFRAKIAPLASGEVDALEFQTKHQRRDGSTYPVQISLHAEVYNSTPVYVAFVTDLTEQLRLEQRLAQAQKLESLGQLAAGIAHEINTPMQCVSNNVEFLNDCHERLFGVIDQLLLTLETPSQSWEDRKTAVRDLLDSTLYSRVTSQAPAALADAAAASRRVVEIVRAMKVMSHPGAREKSATEINDLIRNAATISKNRWKYAAELKLELDDDLQAIPAKAAELSQVFLNLIVNAADAIAEKNGEGGPLGEITVRTSAEAGTVRIEVDDTGAGVPEAIRDKLFDPFFTTKEVGKGTGQGLAITYDVVVNQHGGTIDVTSTEGEGSTFIVHLPMAERETAEEELHEMTSAI